MAERPRRTSRGRRKIEMAKIENETNLLVTFSKRYQGVYKKANEMCSLTGAKFAILGFTPKNKPFSFGCPDPLSVIDKYQNPGPRPNATTADMLVQFRHRADLQQLNEELLSFEDKCKKEKKRCQTVDRMIRERESNYWWEASTEELTLEQLEKLAMDLQSLLPYVSNDFQTVVRTARDPYPFDQINNATANSYVQDLMDYYKPTMDFGIFQRAALPSSINSGIFAEGATSSTAVGCSSNQIANPEPMEMESATGGVLQYAGPSRIQTNLQPISGERSSTDLHYHPRAPRSSDDPLVPYGFDDSDFLKWLFD